MPKLREIADSVRAISVAAPSSAALDTIIEPAGPVVTHDSRRVLPGGIFAAISGARNDGHDFIPQALARGAVAVISERPVPSDFHTPEGAASTSAVWMQVADARAALGLAAGAAHGHPSEKLQLAGITGTNGKTTTAHLVESIMRAAGQVSAMMGTISYRIGEQEIEAEFTTPEASEIQDFLRRAVAAGSHCAVMEVSSHAIDLRRVEGLTFHVAAFTNLTQDHLDYHQTMEEYFAVKRRLFSGEAAGHLAAPPAHSVINLDDPRGAELAAIAGPRAITYALDMAADITTASRDFGLEGLRFTAHTPGGAIEVESTLVGRPHAYNILCAIGMGQALGFDNETIARGIAACRLVSGRFERASGPGDDITVIVDYAHTPDALLNVLRTARAAVEKTGAYVITVFGCGGDRDKTKRPLMGKVAGELSDYVIATSDNPRGEDPAAILADIEPGLQPTGAAYEMLVDRAAAIARAIAMAQPGDLVLLAGKGHETYQILATGKIHFDDREVAIDALKRRRQER
ncbi:MAG: UDP-N-acetylmuramoyl-L-alanyl-D-glutamate--2,6-diaminopimelate ligase [Blastocatellia bacterium]